MRPTSSSNASLEPARASVTSASRALSLIARPAGGRRTPRVAPRAHTRRAPTARKGPAARSGGSRRRSAAVEKTLRPNDRREQERRPAASGATASKTRNDSVAPMASEKMRARGKPNARIDRRKGRAESLVGTADDEDETNQGSGATRVRSAWKWAGSCSSACARPLVMASKLASIHPAHWRRSFDLVGRNSPFRTNGPRRIRQTTSEGAGLGIMRLMHFWTSIRERLPVPDCLLHQLIHL